MVIIIDYVSKSGDLGGAENAINDNARLRHVRIHGVSRPDAQSSKERFAENGSDSDLDFFIFRIFS